MNHIKNYDEYINEGLSDWIKKIGKGLGFALSIPKMMKILGFAATSIGKQSPEYKEQLKGVAEFLTKNGKTLEDKYQSSIEKLVEPMIKDKSRTKEIAKDLLYAATAKHAGQVLALDQKNTRTAKQAEFSVISSIDKENILDNAKKLLPKFIN